MRRRNLKRFAAFAVAFLMLLGTAPALAADETAAEEGAFSGYLFKLKEDLPVVSLMAEEGGDLPEGIEALSFGYYKADSFDTLAAYTQTDWLEIVEPDYLVELMETALPGPPTDPYYTDKKQWNLDELNLGYAWEQGITGRGVLIGIVDSGLVVDHEDMDYDAVHLEPGRNFRDKVMDTTDTTDQQGHGSMVAGIIGATTNNGKGIAGIAPGAKIMPLKCFGTASEETPTRYVGEAIRWGTDQGCDILNLSLGVFNSTTYLRTAVEYALERGVIVIAAAGNGDKSDSSSNKYTKDCYPASYEGVISVAALDENMVRADYSQTNKGVDVTAPGSQILGLSDTVKDGYNASNGTSFSCPTVAAIAALVKEVDPNLTGERLMELIRTTSTKVGEVDGTGRNNDTGYGLIHAEALLKAAVGQPWSEAHLRANGVVVSSGNLRTTLAEGGHVLAVAAGYDESGRMLGAGIATGTVSSGGSVSLEEIVIDLAVLPKTVTLFLLDKETWAPMEAEVPSTIIEE